MSSSADGALPPPPSPMRPAEHAQPPPPPLRLWLRCRHSSPGGLRLALCSRAVRAAAAVAPGLQAHELSARPCDARRWEGRRTPA